MSNTNDEDLDFDPVETASPLSNAPPLSSAPAIVREPGGPVQWADLGAGMFSTASATAKHLPAGVYKAGLDNHNQLYLYKQTVITDELVYLPDSASERVMKSIEKFWLSKERFAQKRQIFKRGILLHGPAGSGKSVLIAQLIKELVAHDGLVLYSSIPELAELALTTLRKIEPERHLICVLEDLDEIVKKFGEHSLLSLLDGETQIKNVVFIATTNYPDQLAKRIINRPSRFDEVVKIGMPSAASRRVYLRSKFTEEELPDAELTKWVTDTKDFSIAHLRELTVCIFCLQRDYDDTIDRLRKMDKTLNSSGDGNRMVGF